MDWPVYETSQIIVGNLESPVAITTLWTNKEPIANQIGDKRLYCAVGTLYNRKVGIDLLVRNLLARPTIRNLIICGHDRARSGEALIKFFRHGFKRGVDGNGNPKWIIDLSDGDYGVIDIEVEEEMLHLLRKNVTFLDFRGTEDGSALCSVLEDLHSSTKAVSYAEAKIFPKVIPAVSSLPAPDSGRVFRSPTVVGAWLQAIREISKFGVVGDTHYNPAAEVLNILTVITAENPNDFFVPDWLPIGRKEIKAYCEQVLTPILSPGARYGYGHRIFKYFGYDQLETSVKKLVEDPDSKSGVINIWDPAKDVGDLVNPKSPCVNKIWPRLRRGKLFMTVTIRSNDIGEAYLGNGFAFRRFQAEYLRILRELMVEQELSLGDLTINSESAHLYESSWSNVEETLNRRWKEVMKGPAVRQDPYGSFRIVVDVESKMIIATHFSPGDDIIAEYRRRTALELTTKLEDDGIMSEPYHAAYLGRELQKAEFALQFGLNYIQDQPLFKVHGPKPRILLE